VSNPQIIIYTDGSSRGNPGPGGYGVILELVGTSYNKSFSEGFRLTTNNRMELLAVIVGLEKISKLQQNILVISDSKYVVDSVEKGWVFGWEKKDYKDKKNPDLWKRFLQVYRKHQVKFKWIKGHNNHPQNEFCDKIAVEAALSSSLKIDQWYEDNEAN